MSAHPTQLLLALALFSSHFPLSLSIPLSYVDVVRAVTQGCESHQSADIWSVLPCFVNLACLTEFSSPALFLPEALQNVV